jgi:hypothetical protein
MESDFVLNYVIKKKNKYDLDIIPSLAINFVLKKNIFF